MTPGDIVMMLNEMGGMRVQATSPSLGAASVRIQGMRGRYTRFFSDGLQPCRVARPRTCRRTWSRRRRHRLKPLRPSAATPIRWNWRRARHRRITTAQWLQPRALKRRRILLDNLKWRTQRRPITNPWRFPRRRPLPRPRSRPARGLKCRPRRRRRSPSTALRNWRASPILLKDLIKITIAARIDARATPRPATRITDRATI